MVDRYTEWADWAGWADESADGRPCQGTGAGQADGNHNLAKVRVATRLIRLTAARSAAKGSEGNRETAGCEDSSC